MAAICLRKIGLPSGCEMEKVAPRARRIYELYGLPEKMRFAYPDDEHDFPTSEREESYRFLEKWLK